MPCVSLKHRKIYQETVAAHRAMRRRNRKAEKIAAKTAAKAAKQASRAQKLASRATAKTIAVSNRAVKKSQQTTLKSQKLAVRLEKKAARQAVRIQKATARATAKSQKVAARAELKSQRLAARSAAKSQKSAARAELRAQKSAARAAAKSARALAKQARQAAKAAPANPVTVAQPAPAPTPLSDAIQAINPSITFASNILQEFQEGISVKILHSKRKTVRQAQNALSARAYATAIASQQVALRSSAPVATSNNRIARSHKLFSRRPTRAELINAESSLGRTLFGPIPAGHRREFFHDRENIWIWHEDWTEANHESRQLTIRYEVRPTGVYKKLAAGKYIALEGDELENFRHAAHAYLSLIKQKLYC